MEDAIEEILAALERLGRLRRQPAAVVARRPIYGAEWRCLWTIQRYGPISNQALAAALDVGAPAASIVVRRLKDLGLVTHRRDPADRRRHLLELTPAGTAVLAAQQQTRRQQLAERLRQIPPGDLETLRRVLTALTAEDAPTCSAPLAP